MKRRSLIVLFGMLCLVPIVSFAQNNYKEDIKGTWQMTDENGNRFSIQITDDSWTSSWINSTVTPPQPNTNIQQYSFIRKNKVCVFWESMSDPERSYYKVIDLKDNSLTLKLASTKKVFKLSRVKK